VSGKKKLNGRKLEGMKKGRERGKRQRMERNICSKSKGRKGGRP